MMMSWYDTRRCRIFHNRDGVAKFGDLHGLEHMPTQREGHEEKANVILYHYYDHISSTTNHYAQ